MPDIDHVRPGPGNSDFQGWASKNNLLCTDGRVIRENAFAHQNGAVVPLVWNHRHDTPSAIIGKATLVNKPDGVYCYGLFNNTKFGKMCKELVAHGDVTSLSILANQLKQKGHDVMHGTIREVSLVLAGANPQAFIEDMDLAHGEDAEYEARIYPQEPIICHGDDDFEEQEPENTPAEENPEGNPTNESEPESDPTPANQNGEENPVENNPATNPELQHADGSEETIQDVIDSMNEKQKNVMYYLVATAREENKEDSTMAHNAFESGANTTAQLTREDFALLAKEAKACSSLKEAVLAHMDDMEGLSDALMHADYGIENIEYLFPDDRNVTRQPQFIQRDMSWVSSVMSGVHHVPFSRIKSVFADITADEARAKGYLKGKLKKEEVFTLLKRSTTPQTIYKKQKLDRDDIIDIVDFDVVAWLKSEMRMMLNEEIARAILVSDGRSTASDDKIKEDNIRPIWTDDDVYTIKTLVTVAQNATDDAKAKAIIRAAVKSRKDYKGSGNTVFFTTEDYVTDMLLMEDSTGRIIYDSLDKLATAMRVRKIVTVPVMEGLHRTVGAATHDLVGIIVDLSDYHVGADKGGAVNMFDDFDIDYNAQKYLIETRCSGALTKPKSAIAIEMTTSQG